MPFSVRAKGLLELEGARGGLGAGRHAAAAVAAVSARQRRLPFCVCFLTQRSFLA